MVHHRRRRSRIARSIASPNHRNPISTSPFVKSTAPRWAWYFSSAPPARSIPLPRRCVATAQSVDPAVPVFAATSPQRQHRRIPFQPAHLRQPAQPSRWCRSAVGCRRTLRRDGLFRGPTHQRNRHPRRARRPARKCVSLGARPRSETSGQRCHRRSARRLRAHALALQPALRRDRDRSIDVRRRCDFVDPRRAGRGIYSRAPGDACRSHGGVAVRVKVLRLR